jgi:DivIVA domain-containing protein
MTLSPTDIRNVEFATQMRGFHREEVNLFLEKVATTLEEIRQENLKLSLELDSVRTQLQGLRQFEDTIKSAAIDARRNADNTIERARQEAELIIADARREAEHLVVSQREELGQIEDKIAKADVVKQAYLASLKELIETHLDMVNELFARMPKAPFPEPRNGEKIEVTDSSEVEREAMTTLTTASDVMVDRTEEANAADEIVTVTPPPSNTPPDAPTGRLRTTTVACESETPTNRTALGKTEADEEIDPELALALKRYHAGGEEKSDPRVDAPDHNVVESWMKSPAVGPRVVETTMKAEDVPPEFIVRDNRSYDPNATDEVKAPEPARPAAYQILDADKIAIGSASESPDPMKLAEELDRVAAKFEEEMDRAAKK